MIDTVVAEDGKTDYRVYFKGTTSDGNAINHLAATGYLWSELSQVSAFATDDSRYILDDACFSEFASILVPKAVAYSASLLNYFFRGTLEITPPDQQVYGIIDGSMTTQQFTTITAKVKNTTLNEAITAGSLVAVARYKVDANYLPDLSNDPVDNTLAPYAYSVSMPVAFSPAMNTTPTEYIFDFSGSPIPAGITDLTLQVVFKGTLGKETDIAVAVGMKNVSEPTHHVFWNLTDMFSLNYELKTAAEIKATPSLAELVDNNLNGIFNELGEPYIDPNAMDFEVAYSSETVATATLPPGRHMRLIGIFDPGVPNHLDFNYGREGSETIYHYGAFVTGAVAENGASTTTINSFRYSGAHTPIRHHFHVGVLNCKPFSDNPDGSYSCAYPEEQAIAAEKAPYPADPM